MEGIDNFDDDTVKLVDAIAERREAAIRQQLEEQRKRNEELERRVAMSGAKSSEDEVKAAVWREVEARTPGLLARVSGGGDLVDAWTAFTHGEKDPATGLPWGTALGEALKRGYAPGITRVFEKFVERNGLARQHDGTGYAATPPASRGAPAPSGGAAAYTEEQITAEMDRLDELYKHGRIDKKTRDAKYAELLSTIRRESHAGAGGRRRGGTNQERLTAMYNPENMTWHGMPEGYMPKVYSKVIDKKFHESTIFTPCFNHKYDGEVKGPGSELVIRSAGEVKVYPYVPGTPIATYEPEARARTIKVGRSWQSARTIRDWEKQNTDLPEWYNVNGAEVAAAFQRYAEDEWFGEAYARAIDATTNPFATHNTGATAGDGGSINLGTAASPVVLSRKGPDAAATDNAKNVLDHLYDMNLVWGQNEAAGQGNPFKYAIVPMEVADLLIRFDAFDRSHSPESLTTLLSADVTNYGATKYTGFNVLESKRLKPIGTTTVGGVTKRVFPILYGDSNAWSWVDLGTESGAFTSNDTPGLHKEWTIGSYDFWLDDARYFGVSYVAL